jgi:hypothetical protein
MTSAFTIDVIDPVFAIGKPDRAGIAMPDD